MAKIRIKMSSGEEFTISNSFYGAEGPMETRRDAEVQASFIFTKMAALGTDQGPTVNVAHIVYRQITD